MSAQSLKPGWKMVKFGEVVKNANLVERNPEANNIERVVGLEHIDPENLHIRRWNSVADGTSFTRKFVSGQTLFGKRRAYQRKVAYAEFDGICSGDILTFESKNRKVLLSELLPFICQSDAFFDHALDTSAGSLSPRTSWKALKEFEFPLPPLDEQKRIAEILWAADEVMESRKILIDRLNQTRIGLGNSVWGKTHDIHREKLGSLCLKVQDGTHFSPQSASGPRRYMTSKNIRDGYLDISECGWITEEEHRNIYRRADVQYGDIVLTKDGANTGNAAYFNLEEEVSLLSSVAFIRANPKKLNAKFLLAFLRSPRGKWEIIREMKGTAITRITLTQIREFRVPVIPIEEQNVFSVKFDLIDSSIATAGRDLNNIAKTKSALLNQLLVGAIHV
ncbi:restriction endonuclease subunit S [Desulfobulbus oligotrophicus]|uniref:Restriction endonuclease subunit S n=1 Tax=Desulfobulbus oligotrophicus TaxID=1909699 RepID=A0A7T6AQP2_9BACT|nr:restriction endonuclease subunit S [Desulfobulbus oligotrophicus]QQG65690.1 restriction endonuclease subunit S [Desulfobulbus oligotrophicus]